MLEDVPGVRDTADDRNDRGFYSGKQVDPVPAIVCCIYDRSHGHGYKVEKIKSRSAAVGSSLFSSRVFMRERYPYDSTGGGGGRRDCFSYRQQSDRRGVRIRGQYPDPDHGRISRILEYPFPACRSIFRSGTVFNLHADQKEVSQKSAFPFVPFLTAAYIGGMIIGAY